MLEEYEELNYQLEKRVGELLDENERLNNIIKNIEEERCNLHNANELLENAIDTLQKRNEEIYEGFMATTKELTEYAEENERLRDLCNKYEEEHRTTFEEWKKTINIIKELEKWCNEEMYADDQLYEKVLNKLQELKGVDKE